MREEPQADYTAMIYQASDSSVMSLPQSPPGGAFIR